MGGGSAELAGTPAPNSVGSYQVVLSAANGVGSPATEKVTITVGPNTGAPEIRSNNLAPFYTNRRSSYLISTVGATKAHLSEKGSLPKGVTFVDNGNGTATLAGTPSMVSTFEFLPETLPTFPITITAANGILPNATQVINIEIGTPNVAPAISSAASTQFKDGTTGSFTITTRGNPYPALNEVGTLPNGLVLVDNGNGTATISGTPAVGSAGTYPVTIVANNNIGTVAEQNLVLTVPPPILAIARTPDGNGYWLVAADGGVFSYGDAGFYGSLSSKGVTSSSVVAMAATPDGKGYWLIDSSGDVWAFGDANGTLGSLSGDGNSNIVGIAVTPDGGGYWLVDSAGDIWAFGDASLHGSLHTSSPIRALVSSPDGGGYWLVAADGGVFSYGDAGFYGSLSSKGVTSSSVVAMAATPDGKGYWLIDSSGDVWAFGDANGTLGSLSGEGNSNIVGIAVTPDGGGYWLAGSDGSVSKFGDASG